MSVSPGRPRSFADPLYGTIRVAAWAATLLATPPFQRLAGVSLSDVPGKLLFGHSFPTRLDHTLGVYHLARLARPRDRALQAAALAHDLGHGPFSHLTEPLMRERLGADHEARSVRLLNQVRAALSPSAARLTAWLDWDEVAQLMLGAGPGGRGTLLNGRLDYDNADNVARFLLCSGLGTPAYDPVTLARALRPMPREVANSATAPEGTTLGGRAALHESPSAASVERVYLQAHAETAALGWQRDRAAVYRYLHEGHHNLGAHAMLRKAVDLSAAADVLPGSFFDMTDEAALQLLAAAPDRGVVALVRAARCGAADHVYRCVWEAEVPPAATQLPTLFDRWRERLALEARLASEAGLAPHEVVLEVLASSAYRALPPLATTERPLTLTRHAASPLPPRVVHLFAPSSAAQDYLRRLRMAAERRLGALGAVSRSPEAPVSPPVLHFNQGS